MASSDRRLPNYRMKVDNRELGTQQLLDALTDHLALYHRKAPRLSVNDKQSDGPWKEKALSWFRSLSLEQRRVALTIFDRSWVALVLQMQRRLAKEGRGYFLVLPDVPEKEPLSASSKPDQKSTLEEARKARKSFKTRTKSSTQVYECAPVMVLPSLCFRKARGLLARLDEEHAAGELLCSNVEVSSSVEAGDINANGLDIACVSEEFLRDPDHFFATMDTITYGGFLSSLANSQQDSLWQELLWLKSMGYYTMAAFVANKLELAMWSAWLNDEGTHRPPKTLCKELRKSGWNAKAHSLNTSAVTVCKRYKAFKDWWMTLEENARFSMLRLAVAKAVKMEVSMLSLTKVDYNRCLLHAC
ncbi:hypothetical protein GOP47_0004402 [Adiantum capillus-veneris]|uniref:Uncharacterized protein n=1 Tax=Adiantum capillus-veneris TaxID=13818 RepID=A0A9D4ZMT5_ADICA|nr:hypothetical protein GOP47_0004402 [Adiantum capillus-veneris]